MRIVSIVFAVGVLVCGCQVREPESQPLQPVGNLVVESEKPLQASGAVTSEPADAQAPPTNDAGVIDAAIGAAMDKSCTGELGLTKAKILAAQCIQVSPATRPPCNANNPCALMRDEINRGCALRDATARPTFCPALLP
jgi:hypothetical protein